MDNSEALLEVRGLYKIFGRNPQEAVDRLESGEPRSALDHQVTAAVVDANFDVYKGEIFVVMGLSGSGKSTLIRTLNGLLEPSAGTVRIGDEQLTGISERKLRAIRERKVSMVFQHFGLLPHRNVLENVAYGLEIQGVPKAKRQTHAQQVIEMVGLAGWESNMPSELSGGMQQRVGIARALATDSELLLMDEAFSALDPLIRREMQQQLLDLQTKLGKTIVFITHDLNEAMFLGERIAVMRDGAIIQIGTPEQILTDPANDYVAQFVQDVDRAKVLTASAVMEPVLAAVHNTAGPRAALRIMREAQTSAAFVTTRQGELLGAVSARQALQLIRSGITELQDLLEADSVSSDTVLAEMVVPSIESKLPLAVVAADGRLAGVVPRVTLLAALGGGNTNGSKPAETIEENVSDEELADVLDDSDFEEVTQ